MKLTLAEALSSPPLNTCKIAAGFNGISNYITSVNSFDAPDVIHWLKEGDLVLTTGYVFKNEEASLIKLVQDLAKRKCAGLGIKTNHLQRSLPSEMISIAEEYSFPIFQIPDEQSIADLVLAVLRKILAVQSEETMEEEKEIEIYSLLRYIPKDVLENYYTHLLSPLIEYDQLNHSDFIKTLSVYLNSCLKPTETAHTLGIHRNTVHQRLPKIKELLGMDFNNGENIFKLQLALWSYQYSEQK